MLFGADVCFVTVGSVPWQAGGELLSLNKRSPCVCAEGKDLKVRFADIGCGFGGLVGTCLKP